MSQRVLWRNARLATCDAAMSVIAEGALVTLGGTIEWIGAEASLPRELVESPQLQVHDLGIVGHSRAHRLSHSPRVCRDPCH